ncbi:MULTISPECIES: hypothetical protein [Pseudoalteromonas]|uniref:Uncharacterized protein n=1 Tax=Pseudoalteromonas obscura TaxID=3048491 RepID=A0ABT7EKP9_9GAMM|nr:MULTISPECIES: hypothetical protein [Pseudoalteromonas]MBQ4837153.1 hypothetical protein [Pseudoalteromonas luteoviolacea]MDK2595621.1 hypothetical protein [Pseudoalteromonas sp. P94(2023)]
MKEQILLKGLRKKNVMQYYACTFMDSKVIAASGDGTKQEEKDVSD